MHSYIVYNQTSFQGLSQLLSKLELGQKPGNKAAYALEITSLKVACKYYGIYVLSLSEEFCVPAGNKSVRELQRICLKEKGDIFGKTKSKGLVGLVAKGNTKKLQEVLQDCLGENIALNEKKPPDHPKY